MRVVCCEEGHFFDYDDEKTASCPICNRKVTREHDLLDLFLDQLQANCERYFRNLYGIHLARESKEPWKNEDTNATDFVKEYSKQFKEFWSQSKYYSYEYIRYEHRDNYGGNSGFNTNLINSGVRYIGYGLNQIFPEKWGVRQEVGVSFADIVTDMKKENKYISYEFILLTESIRCKTLYICIDGEKRFLRISAPLKFDYSELQAAYEKICEKIALQNDLNNFGFFICNGQNIAYRYNCPINSEFDGEEFDCLLKIIIGEIVSGAEYLSFVVNNYRFGKTKIIKQEQQTPQRNMNIKKCPVGHFYDGNKSEFCPHCAMKGKNKSQEIKRPKGIKKFKRTKHVIPGPPIAPSLDFPKKDQDIPVLYGCPNAASITYAGLEDYLQIEEKVYESNNNER